jgi:hypothetical protein
MQHLIGDKLPVIKTEKNKVLLGSRAYTPEQVKVIAEILSLSNHLWISAILASCEYIESNLVCFFSCLISSTVYFL